MAVEASEPVFSAHGRPLLFLFVTALETGLCLVYPFGSRSGEKWPEIQVGKLPELGFNIIGAGRLGALLLDHQLI